MIFRIVSIFILLAALYGGYKMWEIYSYDHGLKNPDAVFTVRKATKEPSVTIVEFMNYGCGACLRSHRVILDYAQKNADITLVVRPLPQEPAYSIRAAEMVLAAGLQGKFWEMDTALSEYEAIYDDKFYEETAAVYEIDYDRMFKDAANEEIHAYGTENLQAAVDAGVKSTPAFIIGKTLYQPNGLLTLPDLIRMVQAEKAQAR